jgi:hypothetical protein
MQEINGLEAREHQMNLNIDTMRHRRADAAFRATLFGRLATWAGRAFALYCVFRVLNVCFTACLHSSLLLNAEIYSLDFSQSIFNILTPAWLGPSSGSGTSPPDVVTRLLASVIALLPSLQFGSKDISASARQISLLLVGAIIMSSVRMLLRGVGRVSFNPTSPFDPT